MEQAERGGIFDDLQAPSGSFIVGGNRRLFYQRWTPAGTHLPVVLVHGGGEHSGRYAETALRLTREGLGVYAFDLPGHGRSAGIRGHIHRFEDYLTDVAACLRVVVDQCAGQRPILLGHSLGGLIATDYAAVHPETIRCLILSSPLWGLNVPVPWWKHALAYGLSSVWPSLTMRRPKAGAEVLSHDPQVRVRYLNDPLVHFQASCRFYVELRRRLAQLPQTVRRLTVPVLILQAGDDKIASAEATAHLFPDVASSQKRLITYDGYYHELFNEVGKEHVFQDLVTWLRSLGVT